MAIGDFYYHCEKNELAKLVVKKFGISDLHTHLRVRPLVKWVQHNKKLIEDKVILEAGCGSGINIFELQKYCSFKKAYGFDINEQGIVFANSLAKRLNISNVLFLNEDLNNLTCLEKIDVLLLIDFLEHIDKPASFLSEISHKLSDEALVIVSVPTPFYVKVFGEKFNEKVGHVINGFQYKEIEKMLSDINVKVLEYKYNTGLLASFFCFLIYNKGFYLSGIFKSFLTYAFSVVRWMDWFNGERYSSSLFIVAKYHKSE